MNQLTKFFKRMGEYFSPNSSLIITAYTLFRHKNLLFFLANINSQMKEITTNSIFQFLSSLIIKLKRNVFLKMRVL